MKLRFSLNTNLIFELVVCICVSIFALIVSPMAFVQSGYQGGLGVLGTYFPMVATLLVFVYVMTSKIYKANVRLLILPVIYMLILILNTYGGYRGDYILAFVAICSFMLLSKEMKAKCFDTFYIIVQIGNVFAIFMYISYLLNINIGIEKVLYYADNSAVAGLYYCQTAHCGRHKPHFDFGDFASPTAQSCR